MAKGKARGAESFENELYIHELAASLLEVSGFVDAQATKMNHMKFIDAKRDDGKVFRFWLKQGWSDHPDYSAVQFHLFQGRTGETIPDKEFLDVVRRIVDKAKNADASHALLVQKMGDELRHWFVLPVDEVYAAYAEQLEKWPTRARNTKAPTLWIFDQRNLPDASCTRAVSKREISIRHLALALEKDSNKGPTPPADGNAFTMRQALARLLQRRFRNRVGDAYGWVCAVSGCSITAVLEAAHLPGRDWREHNQASDGIMLRADLHRLLDAGLATLDDNVFKLHEDIRSGHYGEFHGKRIRLDGKRD